MAMLQRDINLNTNKKCIEQSRLFGCNTMFKHVKIRCCHVKLHLKLLHPFHIHDEICSLKYYEMKKTACKPLP